MVLHFCYQAAEFLKKNGVNICAVVSRGQHIDKKKSLSLPAELRETGSLKDDIKKTVAVDDRLDVWQSESQSRVIKVNRYSPMAFVHKTKSGCYVMNERQFRKLIRRWDVVKAEGRKSYDISNGKLNFEDLTYRTESDKVFGEFALGPDFELMRLREILIALHTVFYSTDIPEKCRDTDTILRAMSEIYHPTQIVKREALIEDAKRVLLSPTLISKTTKCSPLSLSDSLKIVDPTFPMFLHD